jgi:hypothetical protein
VRPSLSVLVPSMRVRPIDRGACCQAIAKARRLVLRLFGAACLRRSCLCTTCGPAACVALPVGRGRAPESGREALACA